MKKVGVILVIVVVVIAAALYFLFSNLNSLVAKAIEKNGSDVTQTSVSVSGVDIALRDGRGTIEGLKVASPEGYAAQYVFSLDDITVDIDVKSLREDPIVIDEIRIEAPVVRAEITKTGSSNVDELRKRVNEYGGGASGEGGGSASPAKKIRIMKLVFEKGSVYVDASALGIEKQEVALPEIRLSDIGGPGGAPPDEIAKIIIGAVAAKAASEVAGSSVDKLIRDKLGDSIGDKAKGLLDKIKN